MFDADVTWFRSKVDWWLGLILVALPLIEVVSLVAAVRDGDIEGIIALVVGCAIVAAIYGFLVIPVRYGISRDRLIIRYGVVRQQIDVATIREVYPTHNPLSSPALSLDRLAVRTGDGPMGMTLIAPLEREEFLTTLASAAGLVRYNDRLVLPGSTDAPV